MSFLTPVLRDTHESPSMICNRRKSSKIQQRPDQNRRAVLRQRTHNVRLTAVVDNEEPIRIPVTDVFDLHTVPAREIKPVVENYLEEAYRMGFRALRIIHGRGIGVQREIVRSILAKTPFVAGFSDAPAEAGGWGATVITLRES